MPWVDKKEWNRLLTRLDELESKVRFDHMYAKCGDTFKKIQTSDALTLLMNDLGYDLEVATSEPKLVKKGKK